MVSTPWKKFWLHKIIFFTRKKIFGRTGHPHAEISAEMSSKFGVFGPKSTFFGLLRVCGTPKWAQHHEIFFGCSFFFFFKKNSSAPGTHMPKFRPKCKWPQNLPFWGQNRPFWTFSGLWSPKMGSAPWKIFWWHKIVFFTRKKIFGHAGHPPAEISAKMTPKFGVFGQKQQILESFWPKFRHLGVRSGRKFFFE